MITPWIVFDIPNCYPSMENHNASPVSSLYGLHNRPRLQKSLSLLGLDVAYTRASGNCLYYDKDGDETAVVDFIGGFGSTMLGHNHPKVKLAACDFLQNDGVIHAQASIRSQSALLARRLSELAGEPYVTTFVNTGTECIEAAIKHALMEWQEKRQKLLVALYAKAPEEIIGAVETMEPIFVALEGAFHGKTAGSISATFNPLFSDMYPSRPIRTCFIKRDQSRAITKSLFDKHRLVLAEGVFFSPLIGVCIELIQGEGGIHCSAPEFVSDLSDLCSQQDIPLIVDEIQTGMYRTGKFLASEWYGLKPDYLALGKSLGGGIAKIGALLVKASRYQPDFGMVHTSTFAEDDFSSCIALKTLAVLSQDETLDERAHQFEHSIRELFDRLNTRFPGVLREVRGKGFMMGIEFNPLPYETAPVFIEVVKDKGLIPWLFVSYLFHRHRVRVAVTLSQSQTLRLEPSSLISEADTRQLAQGLDSLAQTISEERWADLVSHLWKSPDGYQVPPAHRRSRLKVGDNQKKVVFLSHLIDLANFRKTAPFLENIETEVAEELLSQLDQWGNPAIYHQQVIHGANGNNILFELHGISAATNFFEQSLRQKNVKAYLAVKSAMLNAIELQTDYLGLGQYTSIVSDNGLLLRRFLGDSALKLTTGNSFTVGLAYLGLHSLLDAQGAELSRMKVGVVGVAGNICNVYAQMLGDEAESLTLIHREAYDQSPKFQAAVATVLRNSKIEPSKVRASSDLSDIQDCDVVVLGTNTSRQFLMPQHLKANALVLDISVPSNIHPSVLTERPDVRCFQGGYAQLPMGQRLESGLLPCPDGQIFACMAETLMTGLSEFPGHFSLGPVSKEQVFRSLEMAKELGFELGAIKEQRIF